MVLEQTEGHQRRQLDPTRCQSVGHQAERGLRENEEDQTAQRSQTLLGIQGQRSENQVHWQMRQNPRCHQEEVIAFLSLTSLHYSFSM